MANEIKLNIGSGRKQITGFTNIDTTQIIDGKGRKMVDIIMDVEKEKLTYEDGSVSEILVDNVLEHLGDGLIFFMNECHRVLKIGGIIRGCVPVACSEIDFRDITHKRHFTKGSFGYFTGYSQADERKPSHPKYADYGVLPWHQNKLSQEEDLIYFEMSPRK